MRLGELRSIAHNLADSVASGIGLPIGTYVYDIFAETQASPEGFIAFDFVTGEIDGATPSPVLLGALQRYRAWFPELTRKHNVDTTEFTRLKVRFGVDPVYGPHFTVTVEDRQGRTDTTVYSGLGGRSLARKRL